MTENIDVVVRNRGYNSLIRESLAAAKAIRTTAAASRELDTSLDHVHKRSFLFNQAMFTARRVLYTFTLGATAAGAALAAMGIKFQATMEQSQAGMEFILGSVTAAKDEMAALLKISRETIFDLPHITEAGRRLLGMGFDAQQTNQYLMAMSENLAVMGQPVDTLDRIITAFGQIRSRGKLAGQEVLQLVNAQVPVYEILREQLGLTAKEMGNIADANISADTALTALTQGMVAKFGGANAKMLNTVTGQWEKFKENTQIIMGAVMMAPFTAIQQNFPRLLAVMDQMTTAMQNEGFFAMVAALDEGANAGGRLTDSLRTLQTFGQGVTQFFKTGLGPALLDNAKGLLFILKYVLLVTGAFFALASHIPGLRFLLMLLIGAWLAHKVALIINYFWLRRNTWAIVQSYKWVMRYITAIIKWALAEKWSARGVERSWKQQNLFAKAIRWTIVQMKLMVLWTRSLTFSLQGLKTAILTMPIIGWILAVITLLIMLEVQWHLVSRAIKAAFGWLRKFFNYASDHKDLALLAIPGIGIPLYAGKKVLGAFAGGGTAGQTGPYMVGERGPEILTLPARSQVQPLQSRGMGLAAAGAGGVTVQVYPQAINLDGRQVAEVVWKHKLDRFARR